MLRTACLMLDDDETELQLHHLSEEAMLELTTPHSAAPILAEPLGGTLRAQSDAMIAGAVAEARGNIAAAARALGISRNTLYRRLAAMRTPYTPGTFLCWCVSRVSA